MSINGSENLAPKTETLYANYSFSDSTSVDSTNNIADTDLFRTQAPAFEGYSFKEGYFIPLSSVKSQVAVTEQSLLTVKDLLEDKLLRKIYINPFIDPDLEQVHYKVWEEASKFMSLPERTPEGDDQNVVYADSVPSYVCFDQYAFAEKYNSSACRRLINEYHQVIAQSTFSYFFQFRKLVNLLLNELQYIKYSLIVDFGEDYDNEQQREVAVQYDTWAKMAAHYSGRITKTIISSSGEIPQTELDQITKKQAAEFQAFFAIRLNSVDSEISDTLDFLKRDLIDNCDIFYSRYVSTSLKMSKDISNPLEFDFQTTQFLRNKPTLSSELVIATNLIKANFTSIHADIIDRFNIMTSRIDSLINLIHEKRKYSNFIGQLANIAVQKRKILSTVVSDPYTNLFKGIIVNTNRNNNFKSDHSQLDGLLEDSHPQYLLRDGGNIVGDISVADGVTIDGVDLSTHSHNGVDGSSKIKSTDIDYESARLSAQDNGEYVQKPLSLTVDGFQSDILSGGVPVFDTILSIEVDDLALGYEYEISYTEIE